MATATTKIYTLSLHDALPICAMAKAGKGLLEGTLQAGTSAVSDKLLDLAIAQIGERFSRNAETEIVCRLLPEKKKRSASVWTSSRSDGRRWRRASTTST